MQTFLPYTDFAASARVLDRQRLGKQRVEAYQIVRALLAGPGGGWGNHPAVRMWRGHGLALVTYTLAICDEWTSRGYRDSVRYKLLNEVAEAMQLDPETLEGMCHQDVLAGYGERQSDMPSWLGNEDFHRSHRSNLLRKDPVWYGQFGWTDPHDLEYVWPVREDLQDAAEEAAIDRRSRPASGDRGNDHTPEDAGSDQPQAQGDTSHMADESSNENMNREQIVEELRGAGYDGPVSYTKTRLLEMLEIVKAGGTVDVPKRGRKPREASDDKEETPAKA